MSWLYRREGLKVPRKQKARGRLWPNDGSGVWPRPKYPNHVWSFDFVTTWTHDGRAVRLLCLVPLNRPVGEAPGHGLGKRADVG